MYLKILGWTSRRQNPWRSWVISVFKSTKLKKTKTNKNRLKKVWRGHTKKTDQWSIMGVIPEILDHFQWVLTREMIALSSLLYVYRLNEPITGKNCCLTNTICSDIRWSLTMHSLNVWMKIWLKKVGAWVVNGKHNFSATETNFWNFARSVSLSEG